MITINKNSKIFVLCPPNQASGGPELLHQLVDQLNLLGFNALILYSNNPKKKPTPKEFECYNIDYSLKAEDNNNNLLIVPEMHTKHLRNYKNIQKVIWWLSIDFYYESIKFRCPNCSISKRVIFYLNYLIKKNKNFQFDKPKTNLIHFVQSKYAYNHLIEKGIQSNCIYELSDYLNDEFIKTQNFSETQKEDIVLYNPKKGIDFTKKIINNANKIAFLPIENMTRMEVLNALKLSKVYMDFGNHPGKDRLPREAAISGCCILTSKKGSAQFYEDVPINDEFKFEDTDQNISLIISKISQCLKSYDNEVKKFDNYRNIIENQKNTFIKEIQNIFILT